MKRLKPIISSDSENEDDLNLSKIKDEIKKSNKTSKVESESKRHKRDPNQMTIEASFGKVLTSKRKVDSTIDNSLTKLPKIQKKIQPESFLNTQTNNNPENISSSVSSNFINEKLVRKVITPLLISKKLPKKNNEDLGLTLPGSSNLSSNHSKKKTDLKVTTPLNKSSMSNKDINSSLSSNSILSSNTRNDPIIKMLEHKITTPSKKTPTKSNQEVHSVSASHISTKSKAAYSQFMHREGPKALGTKEIPEGSPICLNGMTFVITGVLNSIERDDAQSLIERHGGKVTKAVSGRTTYLIVGDQPGESKVNKAIKMKTKQINENELFELIRTSSIMSQSSKLLESKSEITKKKSSKVKESVMKAEASVLKSAKTMSGDPIINKAENIKNIKSSSSLLVDKYSPVSLKEIIGQQGDRSPANKLLAWLRNFDINSNSKADDDGSSFRAALLSGPPGIGKSTTARLVCKLLKYNVVELNASCVRSKTNIKNTLSESLVTTPLFNKKGLKFCLIMDEVDGMAGNEDRGGINELINLIKTTKHPIICICNDRQSRKLQSFAKYVYDLRFRQLTVDNMRAAISNIIKQEGFSLQDDVLNYIIRSSNFDMRQVLNNLQMWSSGSLDNDILKTDAKSAIKEFKLGPFDVIGKVFSHEGVKSLSEKSDLFFYDYQIGGLFVQENYPLVRPYLAKGDMNTTLKLMSIAAESISIGDIINTKIRSGNNWGLLPTQAMFSSVIPGEYLHGRFGARIQFPSFLGKLSKGNKNSRILSCLCSHISLSTKGGVFNASTLSMDYADLLVKRLVSPLHRDDIEKVLKNLEEAQLLKEDMDLLIEATSWSHLPNPLSAVSTQTKSALTRAYNKSNFKLPYMIRTVKKSLKSSESALEMWDDEGDIGEEEEQGNGNDDDDVDNMIIKKGKSSKSTPGRKLSKGGKSSSKKSEELKEKKATKNVRKQK